MSTTKHLSITWEQAESYEAKGIGQIWTAYLGGCGDRTLFVVSDTVTHIFNPMNQLFELTPALVRTIATPAA